MGVDAVGVECLLVWVLLGSCVSFFFSSAGLVNFILFTVKKIAPPFGAWAPGAGSSRRRQN
jgi:hypothetical protein